MMHGQKNIKPVAESPSDRKCNTTVLVNANRPRTAWHEPMNMPQLQLWNDSRQETLATSPYSCQYVCTSAKAAKAMCKCCSRFSGSYSNSYSASNFSTL